MKLLYAISALLILAGLSFSATITSCQELSAPGTYVLGGDISGAPVNASPYLGTACIKIMASNVTLDCAGHSMTGPGPTAGDSFGVLIPYSSSDYAVVKDCQISGYSTGIFSRGYNSNIEGNTVSGSLYNGIRIYDTINGTVQDDSVYGSGQDGVYVLSSDGVTLNRVQSHNNSMSGVYVRESSNIGVYNSDASHNVYAGFTFYNMTGLTLQNLTAVDEPIVEYQMEMVELAEIMDIFGNQSQGDGIRIKDCKRMNFTRAVAGRNGGNGISVEGSSDITFTQVRSVDNALAGALLRLSSGIRIESAEDDEPGLFGGNGGDGLQAVNVSDMRVNLAQFNGNGGNGFSGDYTDNLIVTNSVFSLNSQNGMHIPHNDAYPITLSHNSFTSNGADGIFVVGAYSVSDTESEYSDEAGSGVHIINASFVNLTSVKAVNNREDGFNLENIPNINIATVNASNNLGNGFSCNTCTRQRVTGSTFSFNSLDGFHNPHNGPDAIRDGNTYTYNLRDGMYVSGSINVQIINSRQSFCNNGRNGLTLENTSGILVNNDTFCSNGNAGVELMGADNTTISGSNVTGNAYGLLFDSGTTYSKTTLSGNAVENNNIANIFVGGTDDDGDGVPNDQDDCPMVYGKPGFMGCPAAIRCKVTSNDVKVTGQPGQQPLAGALCMAFDRADSCVGARHPDSTKIVQECSFASSCATGPDGTCLMGVPVGSYYVAISEVRHSGSYPAHDLGLVDANNSPKQAKLAFLLAPDGKTTPAKSSRKSGSELWIFQPQFVVWDSTQEYYPFVFESDSDWTVNVCVDPPSGYEVAGGTDCVQQIVAGQPKSILFKMVEVGSVPDDVVVRMTLTDPKGKKQQVLEKVGTRLSENLAKAKGVAIDKNGVMIGKAAKTEGAQATALLILLAVGIGFAAFAVDAFIQRKRP